MKLTPRDKELGACRVNGHIYWFNRITKVRKTGRATWTIETKWHGTWRVEGGRKAGGTSRDWFLDEGENDPKPAIKCVSLADALNLIENM